MPPDPLDRALDEAIAGRRGPLFELLTRGSKLPGPRHNVALADAFALAARARGAAGDKLALAMAHLDADEAPGATSLEFLPVWVSSRSRRALRPTRRSVTNTWPSSTPALTICASAFARRSSTRW